MAVSPLGVLLGLVLVFLAPGFFLLKALFPGRRFFGPFHVAALAAYSVALSAAITILVGAFLAFLPGAGPGGRGWFQGMQTGAPVLEVSLGSVAVLLFLVAWWRGAFPLLGREAEPHMHKERGEPEEVTLLRDLRLEEERLRKEASRVRKRASHSRDVGVRGALREAAQDLDRERAAVAKRAREVERRAGHRRYGAGAIARKERWNMRSR